MGTERFFDMFVSMTLACFAGVTMVLGYHFGDALVGGIVIGFWLGAWFWHITLVVLEILPREFSYRKISHALEDKAKRARCIFLVRDACFDHCVGILLCFALRKHILEFLAT